MDDQEPKGVVATASPSPQEVFSGLVNQLGSIQLAQIVQFRQQFGMSVPARPVMLSEFRAASHLRLFQEEMIREFEEACLDQDINGVADALCDSLVVLLHAFVEFGLTDAVTALFTNINVSNCSKEPPEIPNGKLIKGGDYRRPDLWPILCRAAGVPLAADMRSSIGQKLLSASVGTIPIAGHVWSLSTREAIEVFETGVGSSGLRGLELLEHTDFDRLNECRVFAINQPGFKAGFSGWVVQTDDLQFVCLPRKGIMFSSDYVSEFEWQVILDACMP